MVRVAPIRLYYNPKTLWFDPCGLEVRSGDAVVVSTARGTEFGYAAGDAFEIDEAQVKKLKSPLKPVKRLATEEDVERAEEMRRKSEEALPVFKEMAAEANEDMRPVSVEYLLEGDKAVFYFEAEDRVDFRELVRKLASRFRVRVDMRQIGVRDEARMVGGLGHCGQELCCKRLGGEFCPVSIRMAKEQDLSLNPQKISGVCGRLMCCLRYEFEAYKDFKSRAPKKNAQVETPEGTAKVVDLDVPREVVSLKVEGEKTVKVPLSDFDPPEEGARPNRVGEQAWERATAQGALSMTGGAIYATSQLTGQDKLADPTSVRRTGSGKASSARRSAGKGAQAAQEAPAASSRKPRRRRSTKVGGGEAARPPEQKTAKEGKEKQARQGASAPKRRGSQASAGKKQGKQAAPQTGKKQSGKAAQAAPKGGPRPGQKSSGLRQKAAPQAGSRHAGGQGASAPVPGEGGGRKPRRRSHRAGGSAKGGASGGRSGQGDSREA